MKPKAARRLLLIGVVAVVVVTSLVAVFIVRTWQIGKRSESLRAQGLERFEQRDYSTTLSKLAPYLKLHPTDREAMLVYAKAREAIEEVNLRHIREAVDVYRRAFDLDPTDRLTAQKLVKLYILLGYNPEARDLAARSRPARIEEITADDAEIVRGEIAARVGLKSYDQTLESLLQRLIAVQPTDFGAHLTYVSVLKELRRNAEADAHVKDIVAKYPNDPRFQFLGAVCKPDAGSDRGSEKLFNVLCGIAGLDPETATVRAPVDLSDPVFLSRVIGSFDALYRYPQSLAVLREAFKHGKDVDVHRAFVRRAWQAGRTEELTERLPGLDLTPGGTPSEILGFSAMSCLQLKRDADAARVLGALKQRPDDFHARAWAFALEQFSDQTSAGRLAAVKNLRAAMKEDPSEPTFAYYLGEAYAALDRIEEAREQWQAATASPLAQGWAVPYARNSATLLGEGRFEEALRAAERSYRIAPTSVMSNVAMLSAQIAMMEGGHPTPEHSAALLARLEKASIQLDSSSDQQLVRGLREILVPGRVLLLARTGSIDAARQIIQSALAQTPPAEPRMLAHLAMISASQKLGLQYACLDAAQQQTPDDPSLALSRAVLLHGEGQREQALASLTDRAGRVAPPAQLGWQVVIARFLDSVHDERALRAWISLADAHPDDLQIQLAAMNSQAGAGDLALIERVGVRAVKLSGADPLHPTISARLARVRAMLSGKLTAQLRDEAVGVLRPMISESPDLVEARRWLVRALLAEDPQVGIRPDIPAAIDQLRAIAVIVPEKSATILQIAQLCQRVNDFERARIELGKLLDDPSTQSPVRQRAIELLLAQRDFATAWAALEPALKSAGTNASPELVVAAAQALRGLRRADEASAMFHRAAGMTCEDPERTLVVAEGLAASGDMAAAHRVIAGLDALKIASETKELLLGRFAARSGDAPAALAHFEKSVQLTPTDSGAWQHLIDFHLSRREFPKARAAAERALAATPGSLELAVALEQASIGTADISGSLQPLIDAVAKTPGNSERVAALKAVEDARSSGRLNATATLTELSRRYSGDLSVQILVMRSLLGMRPPRPDLAVPIAKLATASFPGSASIARTATAVYRAAGDSARMLDAATAWDQLAGSPESLLAVAEGEILNGRAAKAADLLLPRSEAAKAAPDEPTNAGTLDLLARAMIANGSESQAYALLSPLLPRSEAIRYRVWPSIASSVLRDGAAVQRWVARQREVADPQSVTEQVNIAGTCIDAAQRLTEQAAPLLNLAIEALAPFTNGTACTASVLERLGTAQCLLKQPAAVESFRSALKLDPKSSIALNGLVDATIDGTGDLVPVLATARASVDVGGKDDELLVFALAKAQVAQAVRTAVRDSAYSTALLREALVNLRGVASREPGRLEPVLRGVEVAQLLGDRAAEAELLEGALSADNLQPDTRATLQNNAAYALFRLKRSSADLDRALELSLASVVTAPDADHFDTLGQIQAARGALNEAKIAFRKAIKLQPALGSSLVGLITALAAGSTEERLEAKQLVKSAQRLVESNPSSFTNEDHAALTEVQRTLATGG